MTTTTSDDFYVTLPSDASTDEFQANAPNHFTVRLPRPLHLPGEGWKVGLSSLSLPDTRADLYRLVPKQQYLFSLKWFVLRNGKRTRRRTTVQMDDIDHLDSVVDGEHFMRAIIQHLEGQRRRGRHGDLFINDRALHWYVKWDLVRHGSEVDLKINNTDMVRAGKLKTTKVAIDVALALKMGWLLQKENQDYTLGPNLHWEYIEREPNKPWLRDIEKGIPNFQRRRDWIDLPDERGVNAFWRVTQNKVLHLSMSVHWRFIHLNQAFRAVIGSPMRTLHVYSDIGGSSIVGGQVTDLLREVQYKQQRGGHRLLRTVTRAVLTGAQYLRGSDRKPNRRNQRSAGTLRRAYTHHPHLAFQTGPIKRTRGASCHHKHEFETLHTSRSNRTRLTGRAVVHRSRVFARRVERKSQGLGRLRSGGATDHRRL